MSSAGVEKKKVFGLPYNQGVAVLCVLIGVCLYMVYTNLMEGPPTVSQSSTPAATASVEAPAIGSPETVTGAPGVANVQKRNTSVRGRSEEFHPILHPKRAEDRIDPMKVDPTLRLDLLAKVQAVELSGVSQRNLFQIGPPKPVEMAAALPGKKEPVIEMRKPVGPVPPPPKAAPPPPPPPQPIPLKFYGFATVRLNGKKTAYFLDNDDILMGTEGDILKRRYRVVRIGPNSVLMEDTESKHQQTLPLTEETQG